MNRARAENAAKKLLASQRIRRPPVPVERIVDRLGIRIVYHQMEDHVSGMLVRNDRHQPVIAVNVKHHPNRQRFTIAHELAHFVLHKSEAAVFVDEFLVHFRSEARPRKADPKEFEANQFAGALLMPAKLLKRDLQARPIDVSDEDALRSLARRYEVSAQALTVRLVNLGLLAD